jgi:hypothetical protein
MGIWIDVIRIADIDLREDVLDESCGKMSKELQGRATKEIQDVHYCIFYILHQNFLTKRQYL